VPKGGLKAIFISILTTLSVSNLREGNDMTELKFPCHPSTLLAGPYPLMPNAPISTPNVSCYLCAQLPREKAENESPLVRTLGGAADTPAGSAALCEASATA